MTFFNLYQICCWCVGIADAEYKRLEELSKKEMEMILRPQIQDQQTSSQPVTRASSMELDDTRSVYSCQPAGTTKVLYTTKLFSTVLFSIVLYYAVLYYTILYYTILYYTILYSTVLYCNSLYYTSWYCTVLYCTVLYCTVLSVDLNVLSVLCVLSCAGLFDDMRIWIEI